MIPITLRRLARIGLGLAFCLSAEGGFAAPLPGEEVDRIYRTWDQALAEHAANPSPPPARIEPESSPATTEAPTESADDTEGVAARANRIVAQPDPEPVPELAAEPPAEALVEAATSEIAASTEAAPPAPTPTPGLVKIKVGKVVDGKIIQVEVLVTPTPGPAPAAATAETDLKQATGERAALQQKLKMAASASKKKVTFTRSQLRTLLSEFQAARKTNPNFDKLLPRSKALQVQAALQRVSSLAQGGELPPAAARSLSTLLFPPAPSPAPRPQQAPASNPPSEESYYVDEGAGAGQAEIYIDPDTGQEVYWDGSPVYAEDGTAQPPPEQYYEEPYYEEAPPEGEEYYYEEGAEGEYYGEEGEYLEDGEVYYDENGNAYYEEVPAEEEGTY